MTDFHLRQLDICDPMKLNDAIPNTTIIGAGGIGSSVAIALLKMGLQYVTVFDFDDLENHNLGNQFLPHYINGENFLHRKKVLALQALFKSLVSFDRLVDQFNALDIVDEAYELDDGGDFLTISAVDSMATRKMIWKAARDKSEWLIDGRMAAQMLDIYVVDLEDPQDIELYEASLYSDEEAMTEPCTGRGIIYTSLFAGAHISNIVKQIAFGPPPPRRLTHVIEHNILNVVRR